VNAHLLSLGEGYRSAGINWYIQNLLRHLPATDDTIAYTAFLGDRRYPGVPGIDLHFSRFPTDRPITRILWEQVVQPGAIRRAGVDLIHGPAFVGPQIGEIPSVVTIHDLSFLLYPQSFRWMNRLYLTHLSRWSVKRAERVIAVSASTRNDLMKWYAIAPDKIDIVHNGVDANYRPMEPSQIAEFRANHGLPDQFCLFVGTLEPRKNIVRLVEAYARLPKGRPPLMLVGGRGWFYDEIYARVEALGLEDEVHFVGYVPAEELPGWYNAATLFTYPSLYEGFGLPPLEAMACGTPVIASNASSLPEVIGHAGLTVAPDDVQALAETIARVLADRSLRQELGHRGRERALGFSWRKTASGTVASYRRALYATEGVQDV
jgi:glycosyltransferase involved in cell wall biosynthesis